MKDKIVGILKDSDKALTTYDLEDKLHLLDVDELQELQTCLSELEKDISEYIKFYNEERLQKNLGNRSPIEYRKFKEKNVDN